MEFKEEFKGILDSESFDELMFQLNAKIKTCSRFFYGSEEKMNELKKAYEIANKKVGNIRKSFTDNLFEVEENPKTAYLPVVLETLLALEKQGLKVELVGRWLWISGNTKMFSQQLKTLQCKYKASKKMWFWTADELHERSNVPMDIIRKFYKKEYDTKEKKENK